MDPTFAQRVKRMAEAALQVDRTAEDYVNGDGISGYWISDATYRELELALIDLPEFSG